MCRNSQWGAGRVEGGGAAFKCEWELFFFKKKKTCLVSLLWSVLTGPQIWSRILAFEELAAQREGAWQDDRRW